MSDQEMIERVAKSLWDIDNKLPWRNKHCEVRPYMDRGLAAIKAMREPTDKMIMKLGLAIAVDLNSEACWRNTIDSILND